MELKEIGHLQGLDRDLFGKQLRIIYQKFVGSEPRLVEAELRAGAIRAFVRLSGSNLLFEGSIGEVLHNPSVSSVSVLYILGFSLSEPKTPEIISLDMIHTIEASDMPDFSRGKKWIRKIGMDFVPVERVQAT